jgi:hypothetical protein
MRLFLSDDIKKRWKKVLKATQGANHCLNWDATGFDPDKIWAERIKAEPYKNDENKLRWKEKQRRIRHEHKRPY